MTGGKNIMDEKTEYKAPELVVLELNPYDPVDSSLFDGETLDIGG